MKKMNKANKLILKFLRSCVFEAHIVEDQRRFAWATFEIRINEITYRWYKLGDSNVY